MNPSLGLFPGSSRCRLGGRAPDLSSSPSPFLDVGVPLAGPSLCMLGLLVAIGEGFSTDPGRAGVAIEGVAPKAALVAISPSRKSNGY